MRGVVDNPELLDLGGTSPATVRRWAWIIGSSFAVLAGILLAPTLNLDATVLTLLVVQAFGAAAIGRFSSLPLTYVGGLVIGILASVATKYVVTGSAALAGLPASIPFIVLFLVLIFTPRSKLADRRVSRPLPTATYAAPGRVQLAGAAVLGVVLLAVPHLVNAGSCRTGRTGSARSSCSCRWACWSGRRDRCRCARPRSRRSAPRRSGT